MHLKWHPNLYVPWSKVVHYMVNRTPFHTQASLSSASETSYRLIEGADIVMCCTTPLHPSIALHTTWFPLVKLYNTFAVFDLKAVQVSSTRSGVAGSRPWGMGRLVLWRFWVPAENWLAPSQRLLISTWVLCIVLFKYHKCSWPCPWTQTHTLVW
jgi:hypothetical protein